MMFSNKIARCPVCGQDRFAFQEVLWPELVLDWQLLPLEVAYINRQQGLSCVACGNNLRTMALADAILHSYNHRGTLQEFAASDIARELRVLEINEAGALTSVFKTMPNHRLVHYPEHDIASLAFECAMFDLIVHSDTLEHVPNPSAGLAECHRILVSGGRCIYTVPTIVGRLSRSRAGLKNSYHGSSAQVEKDYTVHTEFGADMWTYAIEAGFSSVRIHCFEYPSAIAIEAAKK